MATVKLSEPIYNSTLTVFYNVDQKHGKAAIEKLIGDSIYFQDNWDGAFHSVGQNGYIWIERFDNSITDIALLSHELLHFTFKVLGYKGMEVTPNNDEAYTYFFQYYQERLLKKMLRV